MSKSFKMMEALRQKIQTLGPLKHAWFTSFNLNIDFFERYVLSTLLEMEPPRSRIDFELMQQKLNGSVTNKGEIEANIDVKVFADQRMYDVNAVKRTAIEVYGVVPILLNSGTLKSLDNNALFHPKVIFLQDISGRTVLGR